MPPVWSGPANFVCQFRLCAGGAYQEFCYCSLQLAAPHPASHVHFGTDDASLRQYISAWRPGRMHQRALCAVSNKHLVGQGARRCRAGCRTRLLLLKDTIVILYASPLQLHSYQVSLGWLGTSISSWHASSGARSRKELPDQEGNAILYFSRYTSFHVCRLSSRSAKLSREFPRCESINSCRGQRRCNLGACCTYEVAMLRKRERCSALNCQQMHS